MAFLRTLRRIGWLVLPAWLALVAGTLLLARMRPADLPWTPLALDAAPGAFTRAKLLRATADPARCRALLARSAIAVRPIPPAAGTAACPLPDAVRLSPGGVRTIRLRPGDPPLGCALAAALAAWEWTVVQPAATDLLGSDVAAIDHLGTFACRSIEGRPGAAPSEHATADAIDVAGFRLADGRRVSVARDWAGTDAAARFLHRVRDGGCGWFGTTLSPDYDRAHRDHLHLDAARRATGVCR